MKLIARDEIIAKAKASSVHLVLSGLVALTASFVVFGLWYPYPYGQASGGWSLFWLVMWVDVCCGPVLTFVLFNSKKPRKELVRDLALVVVIQLAALVYGMYSVMLARPVYLAFEVDRFRVVTLADIDSSELRLASTGIPDIGLYGPKVIATRIPSPGDEDFMRTVVLAMEGIDVSFRPEFWLPYSDKTDEVVERARSLDELKLKSPAEANLIAKAIKKTGARERNLKYLPMQSRTSFDWIVLIDSQSAEVVGFANVDGF